MTHPATLRKVTDWYWFVAWATREIVFRALGGITEHKIENVPLSGPLLVAPVHVSHMDPPLVGCLVPRKVRFMAKKELFFFPIGPFIASVGAFPVNRGEGDSAAIRLSLEELKADRAVLVFPEGTRGDGKTLGQLQPGVAMLAKRSGAKVLPIGLAGSQKILAKGRLLPRRSHCTVVYGQPFTFAEAKDLHPHLPDREAFAAELAHRLQAATAEAGLTLALPPKEPQPQST